MKQRSFRDSVLTALGSYVIAALIFGQIGCSSNTKPISPDEARSIDKHFHVSETYQIPARLGDKAFVTLLEVKPEEQRAKFRVAYIENAKPEPTVAEGWVGSGEVFVFALPIWRAENAMLQKVHGDGADVLFAWAR